MWACSTLLEILVPGFVCIYRVSQEECEILRESVPWVKLYRYNPKHLYPKLNGYGDNGQRSLKLWHLLHTYWLPNSYWNWLEYVVSVMLISVLNIKVTCEWHKAIKLNYKNSRIHVFALLRLFFFNLHLLLSTRVLPPGYVTGYLQCVFFYSVTLHMLFPSCTCCLILFCCV